MLLPRLPRTRVLVSAAVLAVAAVGLLVLLSRGELPQWREGLEWAQSHAHHWWLGPLLALAMAAFLAVGLPGSIFIWISGLLFAPVYATPLLVAGGVSGAIAAYGLARRLSARRLESSDRRRMLDLLRQRGDFVTLVALRVAPGLPHAAVSFASGALAIPLRRYVAATAVGLTIKSGLYVTAIHRATHVASIEEALSWRTTAPLFVLAAVLLVATLVRSARTPPAPVGLPEPEPEV